MEAILKSLTEQSSTFKSTWLKISYEWAAGNYAMHVQRNEWSEQQWAEFLGIETRIVQGRFGKSDWVTFHKGFYNTKKARTYETARNKSNRIARMLLIDYVESEVEKAKAHFESALEKLAYRLEAKGMTASAQISSQHVGVNYEAVIKQDNKVVRAWTIIASGEVQRPHYRYLIK